MGIKVSLSGLKLREKSPVHAKIIHQETGRRMTNSTEDISQMIDKINEFKQLYPDKQFYEKSLHSGNFLDFDSKENIKIDIGKFHNKPINTLILGPGKGAEIIFLKELLNKKSNIDTLGLSNSLSPEANNLIKNDHSPKKLSEKTTFEHFNHLKLVNNYDYIYSKMGPGYHTDYPEITLLKVASMLKQGGIARIQARGYSDLVSNIEHYLQLKEMNRFINIRWHDGYIIIEKIK